VDVNCGPAEQGGGADRRGHRAAGRVRRVRASRSGLAAKHGITIVNAPGTVDAGYRGEIRVTLLNTDAAEAVKFQRGDRIAQLVIQRVARPVFHEVDTLPGSARGEGRLRVHRRARRRAAAGLASPQARSGPGHHEEAGRETQVFRRRRPRGSGPNLRFARRGQRGPRAGRREDLGRARGRRGLG